MSEDKIIRVDSEAERRKLQRRREDQALVRERRYALLNASAIIDACLARNVLTRHGDKGITTATVFQDTDDVVNRVEALLAEIEKREQERQSGHETWLERSELNEGRHE